MNNLSVHPPLSNVQAEMLKVFSADIPEKQLAELKSIMARFLLDSARNNADAIWDEKGYTDEQLQEMLRKIMPSIKVVLNTNALLRSVSRRSAYSIIPS